MVLATRKTAKDLFVRLKSENINALEFNDVDSVSRSFANEFVNLEKEQNYLFKKRNMNKDVSFMFDYALKKLDNNILKHSKYKTVSLDVLLSEA